MKLFRSVHGVTLVLCCIKCGVWLGKRKSGALVDFEDRPHRCTPDQARKPR